MTSRAEHLAWCKKRAHAELEHGEGSQAIRSAWASMASDLTKHAETETHMAIGLGTMMLAGGQLSTKEEMAKFIDGFN